MEALKKLWSKIKMLTKQLNNLIPQLKVPFFHRGLTLKVQCISESCIEIQIKLNVYFHTSLWCLKRLRPS